MIKSSLYRKSKKMLQNQFFDCRAWCFAVLASCSVDLWAMHSEAYRQNGYIIYPVQHLSDLHLGGYTEQQQPLYSFANWKKQLKSCQNLKFAMNAGMYHADYQPVGLFIRHYQQKVALNRDSGYGNFFLQENGVFAWNEQQAVILTTARYAEGQFPAKYATQSGPMLLIDGKINPIFDAQARSKKIRNGVGVAHGKVYLVISEKRVNFYEFADFFKSQLQAEHALYLDGSISSIYSPYLKRHDRQFRLGTMLGVIETCHKHASTTR